MISASVNFRFAISCLLVLPQNVSDSWYNIQRAEQDMLHFLAQSGAKKGRWPYNVYRYLPIPVDE